MRILPLVVALCLALSNLDATPDFLRIYDLLGVDYQIEGSIWEEEKEDLEGTVAFHSPMEDKIYLRKQSSSDAKRLAVIIHELAHWTGFVVGRAPRPYQGEYIEEQIAMGVTIWLTADLYDGEYSYSLDDAWDYLSVHPAHHDLTQDQYDFVGVCISYAYDYLSKELKRLDKNNDLMLK